MHHPTLLASRPNVRPQFPTRQGLRFSQQPPQSPPNEAPKKAGYVAGPLIFLPGAFQPGGIMDRIKAIFHQHGFTPITPLDNPANYSRDSIPPEKLGEHIARGDYGLVDKADFVLANLSPWPPHPAGKHDEVPSADVGTVAEAAYALGKKKPVFTYTNNPLPYHERIQRMHGGKPFTTDPHISEIKRSPDGMMVDMTGGFDNLMLPAIATISGGTHTTVKDATHPYEDLSGIEKALQDVKSYFNQQAESKTGKHAKQP